MVGKNWGWFLIFFFNPFPFDSFELWCWRRLLRVHWTAKRSNQSILKEINPEYSLERLLLKLKLQYFDHLIQRTDSLEKTLMLRKTEGGEGDTRGWDDLMASPTRRSWIWASFRRWWRTGKPGMLQSLGSWRARHDWEIEQFPFNPVVWWRVDYTHFQIDGFKPVNATKQDFSFRTFLVAQWLRLCSQHQGSGFNSWSGN